MHFMDKISFMEKHIEILNHFMRAKYMEIDKLAKPIPSLTSIDDLYEGLKREVYELEHAIHGKMSLDDKPSDWYQDVLRECADVANYCVLIVGAILSRSE